MMQADANEGEGSGAVKGPEPSEGAIDLQHLRRYTLSDQKLEREILQLFQRQLPDLTASLRAAKTVHEWKMAAHSLKGSGRSIGAWRFASLAEEAEHMDFSADCPACNNAVRSLEEAAAEIDRFVAALCSTGQ
jgi:HPt (histidine-containing phosphotransfer) domain-containing protein